MPVTLPVVWLMWLTMPSFAKKIVAPKTTLIYQSRGSRAKYFAKRIYRSSACQTSQMLQNPKKSLAKKGDLVDEDLVDLFAKPVSKKFMSTHLLPVRLATVFVPNATVLTSPPKK